VPTVPYTHPDFAPLRYRDLPFFIFFLWGEGEGTEIFCVDQTGSALQQLNNVECQIESIAYL
jgi:hypothetical protein